MPTKTVTVQYVNPPKDGKPNGSIKTRDGEYYTVTPDKLGSFQPNGVYEIEFTEETGRDGRVWRTIGGGKKTGEAPRGGRPPMGPRETSPTDAKRMFVCSMVNAGIQAGKIEFGAVPVREAVSAMSQVWDSEFGQKAEQPATGPRCIADTLIAGIRQIGLYDALRSWGDSDAFKATINLLSEADRETVRNEFGEQAKKLKPRSAA